MTRHIQSKHEGVNYPCNQCDFKSTTQKYLTTHIQSEHEGLKFSCNQCHKQYGKMSTLKRHIQFIHESKKYACDECDFQATKQKYVRRHIYSKHKSSEFQTIKMIVNPKQSSEFCIECPECRKVFSLESQMEEHFLEVHDRAA